MRNIKEITDIKGRYANHLLLTVSILGFIALVVSLKPAIENGWGLDNITDTIGFTIVLGVYLYRNYLKTEVKIWTLIICAIATGSAGLLTNSVISMFAPYYMLAAVFCVLYFHLRVTLMVVSFQMLFMVVVFTLKINGILTYEHLDAHYKAFHNDNWLNYMATYLFFIVLIVILSHSFYDNLKQTTWTLKDLNFQLKAEINEKEKILRDLRESNEIVAATEDELRATNDELVNVNNELSQKNQELSKYHNYLEEIVKERTHQIYELNEKLSRTNNNLLESNEELKRQKEELASILEKLKKTQAELVQSEKMASLGILTAGIAHEINNPINFISGGVYGLQTLITSLMDYIKKYDIHKHSTLEEIDIEKEKEIAEITQGMNEIIENIQMGVNRTSSIIRSLKIFSYPGLSDQELVNIHDGLDATLIMLQHLLKNRITINKNFSSIPMITCNSSQINQVFMNLLTNAIDSIPNKGEITISTSFNRENKKVTISIADTGSGIPDDIQKNIFEPFFTTKTAGKGTGLGLSISYNIIKEHQGDIYFRSKKGEGTIFFIELPINNVPLKEDINE